MTRRWLTAVALMIVAAAAALAWREWRNRPPTLADRVAQRVEMPKGSSAPCPGLAVGSQNDAPPLVLLVLGQSNAANHGLPMGNHPGTAVTVFDGQSCHRSFDPLPGATGRGASIWSRLPTHLARQGVTREVVFEVLAVGATTVHDWTAAGSPLRQALATLSRRLASSPLAPDLVLWQQGEGDMEAGTTAEQYRQRMTELVGHLRREGIRAPVVLAFSTVCRSAPSGQIREAVASLAASGPDFKLGPDTDTLTGAVYRFDDCHFTAAGRDAAAALWAQALRPLVSAAKADTGSGQAAQTKP